MSEHRHSSGGAMFTLLLVLGFVVMFWSVFAIITGLVVLGIAGWLLARHLDARDAARDAITARADQQHARLLLRGTDRPKQQRRIHHPPVTQRLRARLRPRHRHLKGSALEWKRLRPLSSF
jgi:hypothetical protein